MTERCYEIVGYWPENMTEEGGRTRLRGGKHIGVFVIASTASRAALLVELRYPGARVDGVNCKGNREIIIDTAEAQA